MKQKKILILFFAMLLVLLLPLGAFGEDAPAPEGEPVYPEGSWSLGAHGESLLCDDQVYERLPLSPLYDVYASVKRLGTITIENENYYVGASVKDTDLIYLYENASQIRTGNFHSAYYAKERLSKMDGFLNGTYEGYFLHGQGNERIAEEAQIATIRKALKDRGTETDVTLFTEAEKYWLSGVYREGALTVKCGVFLKTLTDVYFVDYTTLPNSALDSSGYLSTREGTVKALRLEGEMLSFFEYTLNDAPTVDYYEEIGEPPPALLFWILLIVSYLFLGIVIPLVPLIFSMVMLIRKKTLHPSRYVVLCVLSILWILLFALILLVLLL